MTVGKSTRHALYAAMALARAGHGGQVTSAELADRYGIPPAAMAKVFQQMARAGLAIGTRGPRGGYRLARKASSITVLDILGAFEPRRAVGVCLRDGSPPGPFGHTAECRLRRLFDEVDELERCTFASIALDTLVGRKRATGMERCH